MKTTQVPLDFYMSLSAIQHVRIWKEILSRLGESRESGRLFSRKELGESNFDQCGFVEHSLILLVGPQNSGSCL